MVGEILTPGDLGRIPAYGANAPSTSTIPMFYQGGMYTVTPDQIASGASAVDGPSSATDNAIARFDGTTGKLIQNSAATVADTTGAISIAGTTNQFVLGTTNTTTLNAAAPAASITVNLPTVAGTIATTTGSNLWYGDITRCTSALTKNASTSYSNITGLSQIVVPGTYSFVCRLPSTVAGGTEGIKYAFNYTTTVLSSLEATSRGFTASAVAAQHTTSTTTQADLFTQAAVVIYTEIAGTMVVTTGGTIDLQMAQNTSGATNTVALVGGSMEFVRIA